MRSLNRTLFVIVMGCFSAPIGAGESLSPEFLIANGWRQDADWAWTKRDARFEDAMRICGEPGIDFNKLKDHPWFAFPLGKGAIECVLTEEFGREWTRDMTVTIRYFKKYIDDEICRGIAQEYVKLGGVFEGQSKKIQWQEMPFSQALKITKLVKSDFKKVSDSNAWDAYGPGFRARFSESERHHEDKNADSQMGILVLKIGNLDYTPRVRSVSDFKALKSKGFHLDSCIMESRRIEFSKALARLEILEKDVDWHSSELGLVNNERFEVQIERFADGKPVHEKEEIALHVNIRHPQDDNSFLNVLKDAGLTFARSLYRREVATVGDIEHMFNIWPSEWIVARGGGYRASLGSGYINYSIREGRVVVSVEQVDENTLASDSYLTSLGMKEIEKNFYWDSVRLGEARRALRFRRDVVEKVDVDGSAWLRMPSSFERVSVYIRIKENSLAVPKDQEKVDIMLRRSANSW